MLALQAWFGESLLRSLLHLREDPQGRATAWIDDERPFLLALGGAPDLVATKGLLEGPAEDLEALSLWLAGSRAGVSGALLTRFLALPCLLRAFEATVARYGRLRGGTGPLWFLGQAFLVLARLLEAPLRLLALPTANPAQPARLRLQEALARTSTFPAWMEALDLLAPVELGEVRRQARWLALLGPLASGRQAPAAVRDWPGLLAPWCGLVLGISLALLPGGPLAAPVVLLALGLVFRVCRELPLARTTTAEPAEQWNQARIRGRAVPVALHGLIAGRPEGLAVPDGVWLEVVGGRILLLEAPKARGAVEVTGWIRPQSPEVLVGTLVSEGRLRRTFSWLRRLLPSLVLGLLGSAWWMLQWVGL